MAEQISAEEIVREAFENKKTGTQVSPAKILDLEELRDFQRSKRAEYESALRRNRLDIKQWMRYAQFEVEQKNLSRARSIFERALSVNFKHVPLWMRYIEVEIQQRQINHARNLLERAVHALPRVDKLWFKYVGMEETLGNISAVERLYEQWCAFQPEVPVWESYIGFLRRHGRPVDGAYSGFVLCHPQAEHWVQWARTAGREVYELGLQTLLEYGVSEGIDTLLSAWCHWETAEQEYDRARALYRFGLERFATEKLRSEYTQFEKQYGDVDGIEASVLLRRQAQYERAVKEDPCDYDAWLALGGVSGAYYEQAVECVPSSREKGGWRPYIEIWIRYLVERELDGVDCTALYAKLISTIPHKEFSFAKVWKLYAQYIIRHSGDVSKARRVYGHGLGVAPKKKTFKNYIEMEMALREFDRVRKLYEKMLCRYETDVEGWIKYAQLEEALGDLDRARGIYEISLDYVDSMKAYTEFEMGLGEYDRVRALYERRLDGSKDWIARAMLESTIPTLEQVSSGEEEFDITAQHVENTRIQFERGIAACQGKEKVVMLEALREYELVHGTPESVEKVDQRMPTVVRKKEDGHETIEFVFPGKVNKLLEMAKKWKRGD